MTKKELKYYAVSHIFQHLLSRVANFVQIAIQLFHNFFESPGGTDRIEQEHNDKYKNDYKPDGRNHEENLHLGLGIHNIIIP